MLRWMLDTNLCIRVLRDRPASLRARFVTDATALPIVTIHHPPLSAYEGLAVANQGDAA